MKTICPELEIRCLANLCNGKPEVQEYLKNCLTIEHFGIPEAKEVFHRVNVLINSNHPIPPISILKQDPVLSDEAKNLIENWKDFGKLKTLEGAKSLHESLKEFYKSRILYECHDQTLKILRQEIAKPNEAFVIMQECIEKKNLIETIEVLPFPFENFPFNEAYCFDISERLNCEPQMPAVQMLTTNSTLLGRDTRLQIEEGFTVSANLWSINVAPSSTKKTAILEEVQAPISELNEAKYGEIVGYKKIYKEAHKKWEAAIKKNPTCEEIIEPEPVKLDLLLGSTTTVESLIPVLRDSRGLLLTFDEISGWLKSHNQYKTGGGDDRQQWCSMYSGAPIHKSLKDGIFSVETLLLKHYCLAMVGNTTPSQLKGRPGRPGMLQTGDNEDGLLQRFLYCFSDYTFKDNFDRTEEQWRQTKKYTQEYISLCKELYKQCQETRVFKLTPEAHKIFNEYRVHIEGSSGLIKKYSASNPALTAAFGKLTGYLGRLALNVHCVRLAKHENISWTEVDETSMEIALTQINYFEHQLYLVFQKRQINNQTSIIKEADGVLDKLMKLFSNRNVIKMTAQEVRESKRLKGYDIVEVFKQAERKELGKLEVSSANNHKLIYSFRLEQ